MKLYREKAEYVDNEGVAHPYYTVYVGLDNGDLIPIKPLYKNDKVKLSANAVNLERGN